MIKPRMTHEEIYELTTVVDDLMLTIEKLTGTMYDNDTMTDEWLHEIWIMEFELKKIKEALHDQVVD